MALELILTSGLAIGGSWLVAYIGGSIAQNIVKYLIYYDEFENEEITTSDLKPVDDVFIPGSKSRGLKMSGLVGYYHHAVYLGVIDGKQMVTDFGAVNANRPVIRELSEFLNGYSNKLYRRKYKHESAVLSPEQTLKYAKLICYGKNPWPEYSLNTNNCEHYASLLKMAQVYSSQATHLPQDIFYRQLVVPNLGRSILRQQSEEN